MPVVLSSVKSPTNRTNPFIQLLEESLACSTVRYFSWREALTGAYDIFHLHWPENLFRANGLYKLPKAFLSWLLILKITLKGTPVVWTVHNEHPHEPGGRFEQLFLRCLTSQIKHRVVMSESQLRSLDNTDCCSLVPHGHYKDWLRAFPADEKVEGRFIFWGLIRPYKGVESLIRSFQQLDQEFFSLHLVGKPSSNDFGVHIRRSIESDSRIMAHLDYADDELLVREITQAAVTVLPYRRMGNSGAVLYSLSLGRPVLVPDSAYARELQAIVGADWIHVFDGDLAPEHLERSMEAAKNVIGLAPALDFFEWDEIGRSYETVYRQLLAL